MGTDDIVEAELTSPSTSSSAGGDRIPYSGPLSGPLNKRGVRKNARFNDSALTSPGRSSNGDDDLAYVEITLDVRDDSVAVHSVKPAGNTGGSTGEEDPDMMLLARTLEKRSVGSNMMRSASSKFRQVSQELRRLASGNRRTGARIDRSKSATVHALKGLKFISKTDGGAGWSAVEKRFDELASSAGLLHKSKFGQCIGT